MVWMRVGDRRFGQTNREVDLPFPKKQAGGEEVGDGGPAGHPKEVADRQVEVCVYSSLERARPGQAG